MRLAIIWLISKQLKLWLDEFALKQFINLGVMFNFSDLYWRRIQLFNSKDFWQIKAIFITAILSIHIDATMHCVELSFGKVQRDY